MTEWLRKVEERNMPHFARGCVLGLGLWIFGIRVFSFGMAPVLFSFVSMLVLSVMWEIYDQIRWNLNPNKYDGFDPMDIVCDLLGVAAGHLWHLSTHRFDT